MPKRKLKIVGKRKNVKNFKKALVLKGAKVKVLNTREIQPILSQLMAKVPRMLANKLKTKIVYEDDVQITASYTSPQFYVYACNDIFDPNVTGTGHQPYFHDQLAQLYTRYDVIRSKIFVQYYQPLVVNNNLSWMRVFTLDAPTLSGLGSSIYAFREANLGSPAAPIGHWDFNGMFDKSHVEGSWSLNKYVKQKDADYGGLFGGHPLKYWYYVIGISPPTGADTYPVPHQVRVRIEFDVVCSEPKLHNVS